MDALINETAPYCAWQLLAHLAFSQMRLCWLCETKNW